MKLKQLFARAVELGIEADPRGKDGIKRLLKKQKDRYDKLEGKEKEFFDTERLWNPYGDSRIINGNGDEEVRTLMVGIDMETSEMLLADRMREKGERIDAIMIHHPEGRALADLEQVMPVQVEVLTQVGVPVNHSEAQLRPRMDRIRRAIHADNLFRTERAAELLGFPAFCCHTVSDNLAWGFMEKNICKKQFDCLDDLLNALRDIPEFNAYAKRSNQPLIVNGSGSGRTGKIVASEFTGGTNGPEEFLEEQSRAGVGTILSMHVTEKTLEEAKKHHVNMVQCSHMASDSLGINLLLDKLSKDIKGFDVLPAAGFIRVKRR